MGLIDKINNTLTKLNIDLQLTEMAKVSKPTPAVSGETTGQTLPVTTGGTLPNVVISDYIPANGKVSYSAIGAPVLEIIGEDEEEPAEDGTYNLVTKKTIVVKAGKLVSEEDTIESETGDTKTTMAKVEVPVLELKDYPWEKCIADQTPKYGAEGAKKICGKIKATNMSAIDAKEILEMAANPADSLKAALQKAGIKLDKKGDYCLDISVGEDGTIQYGTLRTNTYENLLMAKEDELSVEVDKLTNAFETRLAQEKDKYSKLVEAHMHGVVPSKDKGAEKEVKLSKTDILKQQIASKVQSQE